MLAYTDFYKRLAVDMDFSLSQINNNLDGITIIMGLFDYLVDVTTDSDFDANRAVNDIGPAIHRDVYTGLITLPRDESKVYDGVRAVNEHTKRYINDDLTDFVNNEVWPAGCVPTEWARVSALTGEDVSGWNVC